MQAQWLDDGADISAEQLNQEGVHYRHVSTPEHQAALDELKRSHDYVEQDEVALSPATPDLDALLDKFLGEHLHDEDEVRLVLEGEGVFDIRSRDDRWMRVRVTQDDLIVVPAQRHHRFKLTAQKTIRCARLFKDKSGWTPHYRQSA